ncbi:MAG: hypothetical protein EBZ47_08660 [Chlamydiae bacterium]|nr:hypothetical protein [Chlamydiota bacterium]
MRVLILIVLCLTSCKKCPDKVPPFTYYPIQGREEILPSGKVIHRPVYKVKMPVAWKALPEKSSLTNIAQPNALFEITPNLHLAFYSFPDREQVPSYEKSETVECNGFKGVKCETAERLIWHFGLDPKIHEQLTHLGRTHEENAYFREMGADFRIEVRGSQDEIASHRDEIFLFAESVELFQAIPI